MNLVPHHRSGT